MSFWALRHNGVPFEQGKKEGDILVTGAYLACYED